MHNIDWGTKKYWKAKSYRKNIWLYLKNQNGERYHKLTNTNWSIISIAKMYNIWLLCINFTNTKNEWYRVGARQDKKKLKTNVYMIKIILWYLQ